MYLLGFLFYVFPIVSYFLFPAIGNMIRQAILLAPVISYGCLIIWSYPLFIFLFHIISNRSSYKKYNFLSVQAKLSASVCVSLGLIGTFLGLTDMIASIAGSLSGDGDISSKMNAMISSIASALNAMSFAFLTSIIGVAISVLILLSLNFWSFFYKKDEELSANSDFSKDSENMISKLSRIESINLSLANKLIYIPEASNHAEKFLEVNNCILSEIKDVNKKLTLVIKNEEDLYKKVSEIGINNEKNLDAIICKQKTILRENNIMKNKIIKAAKEIASE
ncbi:TPA: hypothetical protein U0V61_004774 [Escherichia coli]|nr:hypothetical protein [Escherichia marmotae]MEC9660356.1 hypothetical protein [Escherichia coli]MED8847206.1 hypothetical protein [Escherichia coli]MED9369240.1 hypothetical protein [Escherichia coli]MED9634514.1 hypothetical protein [Escherichia marmotae]